MTVPERVRTTMTAHVGDRFRRVVDGEGTSEISKATHLSREWLTGWNLDCRSQTFASEHPARQLSNFLQRGRPWVAVPHHIDHGLRQCHPQRFFPSNGRCTRPAVRRPGTRGERTPTRRRRTAGLFSVLFGPGCRGGVLVAELGGKFATGADPEFGVDVGEVELDGFDADE